MSRLGPCAIVAGVFLQAASAPAQTQPLPRLPAPSGEASDAAATAQWPASEWPSGASLDDAAPAARGAWQYALGAGLAWDENPDLLASPRRGLSLVPRAAVARTLSRPHAEVRVTAAGHSSASLHAGGGDRYFAEGGLAAGYRPSPRVSWRARVRHDRGESDSSRVLLDQGVVLPGATARSLAVAFGTTRQVAPRMSLRLDGRLLRTRFARSGLIDGDSVRGTVGLERQLSSRNTAALEYSLERVAGLDDGHLTHFASLQWTRVLSGASALLLEAGVSDTPAAQRAGLAGRRSFFGGASYTRQVRRTGLTVFGRREVVPGFGLGISRLETRIGVSAARPLAGGWQMRWLGVHVLPDPEGLARVRGASHDVVTVISRRFERTVEFSVEARYRRGDAAAMDRQVGGFRAGFFVTVSTPAGRAIATSPGL